MALASGQTVAYDKVASFDISARGESHPAQITLISGEVIAGDITCVFVAGTNAVGSIQVYLRDVRRIDFRQ